MKTRYLLLVCLLSLFMALPVAANDFITHDEGQLQLLKTTGSSSFYQTKDKILAKAKKILTEEVLAVTDKTVAPPSGDYHDYISLGIYYWPDPSKAEGLPYINQDGQVNPEKDDLSRFDAHRMDKMTYNVNALALAYYLTNDEAFARKAIEILDTWFIKKRTCMNPNLNFGQIHPGKGNVGSYSGIIETGQFIPLIDSIHMLEPSKEFSQAQQAALKGWFNEYLDWLLTSKLGTKEALTGNNHAIWYDAQTAVYAHFAGRDELACQILLKVPDRRIAVQIEPDGKMPREIARTRGKHYTLFTLKAFTVLGRLGDTLGVNLFDYRTADGRGIHAAFDWFIPYALDNLPWPYKEISAFSQADIGYSLYLANLHYREPAYEQAIDTALHKK